MGHHQHRLDHLLATEGLVVAADHPELTHSIRWRRRTAGLQRSLPGVHAATSTC